MSVAVECSEELKAQTKVTTRHEEEIDRLRVLLEGSASLVQVCCLLIDKYTAAQKKRGVIFLAITSSTVNRFVKLFHC